MKGTGAGTSEPMIDHRTSQAICNAVGERLQRDLQPQFFAPAPRLEHLLDELRKQDEDRSLS